MFSLQDVTAPLAKAGLIAKVRVPLGIYPREWVLGPMQQQGQSACRRDAHSHSEGTGDLFSSDSDRVHAGRRGRTLEIPVQATSPSATF